MDDSQLEPAATFSELLGSLIVLLRESRPREEAISGHLDRLAASVATDAAVIEAGIENSWALDGDPLKERLQVRQVDAIHVAAGAAAPELLALARALADDDAPIPSTAQVRVKLLPDPLPLQLSGPRPSLPDAASQLPRARPGDQLAGLIEGILRELEKAVRRQQWLAVLHDAQAAARLLPGLQEDIRRAFAIALRRLLARSVAEALIEQAYRMPEEQARTAEVLRAAGYPAADLILEILGQSQVLGPRAFLLEALGGMPEAFPLIAPLLDSRQPGEARMAAELLGRLGVQDAVPILAAHAQHPDEGVRLAVIDALGCYRDKASVEPLHRALAHPSAVTRGRAARALAARGSAAMAMPLLAAVEAETDPAARDELLDALVAIATPDAIAALVREAAAPRPPLGLGAARLKRQLAIVRSLGRQATPAARHALEQIARAGKGEVRAAAEKAVRSEE